MFKIIVFNILIVQRNTSVISALFNFFGLYFDFNYQLIDKENTHKKQEKRPLNFKNLFVILLCT